MKDLIYTCKNIRIVGFITIYVVHDNLYQKIALLRLHSTRTNNIMVLYLNNLSWMPTYSVQMSNFTDMGNFPAKC